MKKYFMSPRDMLSSAPTAGYCATEKLEFSADGGNAMILGVKSICIYFCLINLIQKLKRICHYGIFIAIKK